MSTVWWQLPGPARFIHNVIQDIHDGKNVVICLPDHFPTGLAQAVRAQIQEFETMQWYTVPVTDDPGMMPTELLYQRILGQDPPGIASAATLAREDNFNNWLLWINSMTMEAWADWCPFIKAYAHSCRSRSVAQRTVFVIVLQGEVGCHPPGDDICLAIHQWQEIVDRVDMQLYTAIKIADHPCSLLHRQLAINCITNLAQWDPLVADAFIHQPLRAILEPQSILADMARQRGWQRCAEESAAWHTGQSGRIHGQRVIHSALTELNGDQARVIEKRIWSAQVGILLPYVDEQRQDLIDRLRGLLEVPVQGTDGNIIDNVFDLEIGHIYRQISILHHQGAKYQGINLPVLFARVQLLWNIRNKLAHLTCVPEQLVANL